jgi:UDP-N-acetylmuramoyl-tripeptide--D-alanyl-D-alanine ligase
MLASLNLLSEIDAERRIAVLGDMLELGPYERQGHEMVGLRAAQVIDLLVTVGRRAHMIAEAARRAGMKPASVVELEDSAEAVRWLQDNLTARDAALVKGSHGLRMDRIIAAIEVRS